MRYIEFKEWSPERGLSTELGQGPTDFEALAALMERLSVPVPSELIGTLPYVLTIVALVGVVGRARAPAALGVPYTRAGA